MASKAETSGTDAARGARAVLGPSAARGVRAAMCVRHRPPGLAESSSRPSRESLKTPSRAESLVAPNKTESYIIESCYYLVG